MANVAVVLTGRLLQLQVVQLTHRRTRSAGAPRVSSGAALDEVHGLA